MDAEEKYDAFFNNVKEKLVLKSSSIVKGDICLQTLEVEPGAKIEGRISSNS